MAENLRDKQGDSVSGTTLANEVSKHFASFVLLALVVVAVGIYFFAARKRAAAPVSVPLTQAISEVYTVSGKIVSVTDDKLVVDIRLPGKGKTERRFVRLAPQTPLRQIDLRGGEAAISDAETKTLAAGQDIEVDAAVDIAATEMFDAISILILLQ